MGKGIMKTMKIIDIDDIPGRHIDTPGMTRTIKDILATDKMTTHLGSGPPGAIDFGALPSVVRGDRVHCEGRRKVQGR